MEREKVFLISPVRQITDEEKQAIAEYVQKLEADGYVVHWPIRDTKQDDPVGLRICKDNREAIISADEIHLWYSQTSSGSIFDLGMAFALEKKLVLATPIQTTDGVKGFNNMVNAWAENGSLKKNQEATS